MPTITEVKKDRIFYKNFSSLIEVLKSIAGSQFQSSEHKIKLFPELTNALYEIVQSIDLTGVNHPMANPGDLPVGALVITSDSGLMGGVNYKLMSRSINHATENKGRMIVVGTQGQKFTMKLDIPVKTFPGVIDTDCLRQAHELADYIVGEVVARRMGALKVYFPYAASIASQYVLDWDFFPCTLWNKARLPAKNQPAPSEPSGHKVMLESDPGDLLEYVSRLWIGQKLYEIFQLSRVAEYAARVVHLEESTHRVKEIEHKLKLKYFRIHHGIIDQQMRELFTARSIYV